MNISQHYDVIILGAGASGLFCAQESGKRGKRVLVLEHQEKVGKKILISGGGRCNFTNLFSNAQNFLSSNSHFCKSALARFQPDDFLKLIAAHRIEFFEKKAGQLFCKNSSKAVVNFLLTECHTAQVDIKLSVQIHSVTKNDRFSVHTSQGIFSSPSLVVATGGLSFEKLGASNLGYRLAQHFGIHVIETFPALVPLTLNTENLLGFEELSGISLIVDAHVEDTSFAEDLLFTHRGLSGPAILQISSYWALGKPLIINLLPTQNIHAWLIQQKQANCKVELKNALANFLPKRFCEWWCGQFINSKPIRDYSYDTLAKIAFLIEHWTLTPHGTEGYAKAEVTRGGVDTQELSSKTMESKKVPGLFFIGEVVDVTGHLGGHNFQWAWASAHAAASFV